MTLFDCRRNRNLLVLSLELDGLLQREESSRVSSVKNKTQGHAKSEIGNLELAVALSPCWEAPVIFHVGMFSPASLRSDTPTTTPQRGATGAIQGRL